MKLGAAWLLGTWALLSCGPSMASEDPRPLVVVTIFPVADVVAAVAGPDVRVETLLPPRASHHTWEATPGQIRALARATGYVTVGGGLDGWLEGLGADAPGLARLRLTEGLALRRAADDRGIGDGETGDPHVWLDPVLVRDALLPRIASFLEEIVPGDSSGIRSRAASWADTLTALDSAIRADLEAAPSRGFIATHDAWSYFAGRYGLEAIGSLYERPGHEPSARGLAGLVDAARATGLTAVLAEPQLAETAAIALAGEIGAEVILVDPLGGPGLEGRESYTELMRFNARSFAHALRTR